MSTSEIENTTAAIASVTITDSIENPNLANTAVDSRPPIDPETTIFIGNVAHESSPNDLKKIFEDEFGSVEVEIPEKEHKNGRIPASKHALVKFPKKIDFDAIKDKYDLTVINDREIHIKRARTSDELREISSRRFQRNRGSFRGRGRGTVRGRGRGSFRGSTRGGFTGPVNPVDENGTAPSARHPRKEKIPLDQMERTTDTLYINNIPFDATKESLATYFGTAPDLVILPMRRYRDRATGRISTSNTRNRGIAFITYNDLTVDISEKVKEFNGKFLEERPLVVDVAVAKPETDEHNEETHAVAAVDNE